MTPIIKWVGSKRWIAPEICHIIKSKWNLDNSYYFEPFFGGGSVYFELCPPRALILDKLEPLMEFYKVIASQPISVYNACVQQVNLGMKSSRYYTARSRFNYLLKEKGYVAEFAALFIYLNKLGYNGLWRQNQQGEYNVPYGKHSKLKAPCVSDLIQASELLKSARICIEGKPDSVFEWLENARKGDIVFVDPPYIGTFNGWDGFGGDNAKGEIQFHIKLANKLCNMVENNIHVIAMNSVHELIRERYSNHFEIKELNHQQNIAPDNKDRNNAPQFLMISRDLGPSHR